VSLLASIASSAGISALPAGIDAEPENLLDLGFHDDFVKQAENPNDDSDSQSPNSHVKNRIMLHSASRMLSRRASGHARARIDRRSDRWHWQSSIDPTARPCADTLKVKRSARTDSLGGQRREFRTAH